ncbi:hypothetical protein F4805DRAFT_431915 [Annulohypoxylon moriforme]|nr:hypothetical protein F4805DRAFT_431915 [Annulohypoxylon moriforme]
MNQQDYINKFPSFDVFADENGVTDIFPASYHLYRDTGKHRRRYLVDPTKNIQGFLRQELSIKSLEQISKYLWLAGAKHDATQLHIQVATGRKIVPSERIDSHLPWDNGIIYIKPIPRYILSPIFWKDHLGCSKDCTCNGGSFKTDCDGKWRVASGFLYSYLCLISSETDFLLANEKFLLPRYADGRTMEWEKWKKLSRELLEKHDPEKIHPRFLRAELRLSRLNTIHRFTRWPPFNPYLRGWRTYGSLFRHNLSWMAAATVFIALVLTAMQVGLATNRLKDDVGFQRASYGFTVFAILGPICAFGLVVFGAAFNLAKDVPWLLAGCKKKPQDNTSQPVLDQQSSLPGPVPGNAR